MRIFFADHGRELFNSKSVYTIDKLAEFQKQYFLKSSQMTYLAS